MMSLHYYCRWHHCTTCHRRDHQHCLRHDESWIFSAVEWCQCRHTAAAKMNCPMIQPPEPTHANRSPARRDRNAPTTIDGDEENLQEEDFGFDCLLLLWRECALFQSAVECFRSLFLLLLFLLVLGSCFEWWLWLWLMWRQCWAPTLRPASDYYVHGCEPSNPSYYCPASSCCCQQKQAIRHCSPIGFVHGSGPGIVLVLDSQLLPSIHDHDSN